MANCGGQKMAGSDAQLLRSSVFDATPPANTTLLPGYSSSAFSVARTMAPMRVTALPPNF